MSTNRSLSRFAALTGAVAFLLSFAHGGPVAAQASTRYARYCSAVADPGVHNASCSIPVPAGKVFVIESATFGGLNTTGQLVQVRVQAKSDNITMWHSVPAGTQVVDNPQTWWSGALPGTIFAEPGSVVLYFYRGPDTAGQGYIRMTLSGHLEDL
jgi:hypothetical protein